jgi:cytoskeletal protein RodZ
MPIPTPLPLEEKTTEQKHEKPVTTTDTSNSTQTQTTEDKTGSQKTDQTDSATDKKELETNPQSNTENKTETPKSDATSSSNSDIINIKLVFNKEVWMRIRDKENKTLFEATNSAGKEKVLDLKKPLTFRVGNAQGLSLFVDGKPVDINGYIKGSVANFTLE